MKPGQLAREGGCLQATSCWRGSRASPASGASFLLLPPDNATGNFTKIVQRVPVKLVFEADGPA